MLRGNLINESKLLNEAARGVFKQSYYKCMDQWLLECTWLAWRARLSRERAACGGHSFCGKANAIALHSPEHMVMMHLVHSAEPEERDVDSLRYIMRP